MTNKPSIHEIITDVSNGDVMAFRALFDAYRDKLYFFLLRIVETKESAEDIVQDTFLKVWLNRNDLQNVKNFNAYLYQIAKNAAINGLRRKALEAVILESNQFTLEATDNEEQILLKDLRIQIQKAVEALPAQQRKVFTLRRNDHYKIEEIAEQLQISHLTVKRHLTEALKSIRHALKISYKEDIIIILVILRLIDP
ncbi:RNA polymerase sigma-70 factor [Chitinophaga silvatica]|uniref:RNA polymerase sigma factor n=1 Tax=Chitinophaga silvatica TaxID=2282649 RepID=A0A3E1Y925_9BACT|nr:RNA polymerase sigma-70 factor [Chitinophaga silvatica]RFS21905.1 RNA polymerase sigma-70 factor [Chitinophaga silvatica]